MGYGDLRRGRYSAIGQAYLVTSVCAQRRPVFRESRSAEALIHGLRRL
ncbi:hypothetical protein [Halofilum ochraceum]